MIKTKDISKIFHSGKADIAALKDINLNIDEGEFVAIMGPSGAGKSTLLYQLGLLDHPTSGEIIIDNYNTENLSEDERTYFRLKQLGFVFQDYALLPELTATENVYIPLLMLGYSKKEAEKRAIEHLERVGLGQRSGNLPSQLSGGEQQRVSIARAIAHEPKILFADEPTASLDSERSFEIMQIFKDLNEKEKQTIVMVTHEPEYSAFAKRIVKLKDGEIISDELNK